jgi:hypothetical protein
MSSKDGLARGPTFFTGDEPNAKPTWQYNNIARRNRMVYFMGAKTTSNLSLSLSI